MHAQRAFNALEGAEEVDGERIAQPFTRSKSSAGPPSRTMRCAISAISKHGSTSTRTRFKSRRTSSSRRNERRSKGRIPDTLPVRRARRTPEFGGPRVGKLQIARSRNPPAAPGTLFPAPFCPVVEHGVQ
jgi:hypothetical protein